LPRHSSGAPEGALLKFVSELQENNNKVKNSINVLVQNFLIITDTFIKMNKLIAK
jgi:hypothetical protein